VRIDVRLLALLLLHLLLEFWVVFFEVLHDARFDVVLEHFALFLVVLLVDQLADQLLFVGAELLYENTQTLHVDVASVSQVVRHNLETVLVDSHQYVNSSVSDAKARIVR